MKPTPAIGDVVSKPVKIRKKNYVNNRDFFNALVAYAALLKKEPEKNHPIPNYIGECI